MAKRKLKKKTQKSQIIKHQETQLKKETGLTSTEAKTLLKKHGYNALPSSNNFSAIKIFIAQFTSALILILMGAAAVSIYIGEIVDGIAILVIVVINAIIGFMQEYKAENAVKALKSMLVEKAIVIRDGSQIEIPVKLIVPGDIIVLNEGDKIPADAEILKEYGLKVDEAILTGESVPKDKGGEDKTLYKGTIITTGRATAIVTSTGLKTEFGKIVELVSKDTKSTSPLTVQLDELGKKLGGIILVLITILFILGALRQIPVVEMLMTSVALGVSAIPEGMPIIVTLTLAMGVQALSRKKAIVRRMNAIETLGATTVICSDKTGTLTLNEMTVKVLSTSDGEVKIKGSGYSIKDKFKLKSKEEEKLMEICENCNSSFVDKKSILGDPTEIALKILTRKSKFVKKYEEIDELPFSSDRKMMSSLVKIGKSKEVMTKGAFEEVIKKCTHIMKGEKSVKITKEDKQRLTKLNNQYAAQALRVLGFAYKKHKNNFDEKDLTFVGLIGMIDPPRKTVKHSIKVAHAAGIKIKIITGDNAITAKAIGKLIGLDAKKVVEGKSLDKLSDKEALKIIKKTDIFARTRPEHKYRIVHLLKRSHEVVTVTGDGVNDAPALKHADVGVAMGIKGTEATKEVADIVLKDDNFSTIVTTIKEGRKIYHNILAFIKYMLSANFITIIVVGLLTIIGMPLPILPLQVLWLNIATDSLPALALGSSPANKDIMKEKPHPKKENILKKFFKFILVAAIVQTIINVALFIYGLKIDTAMGIVTSDLTIASYARTMLFTQTVVFELLFAFVCKEEKSITVKSLFSNKSLIWAAVISFMLQLSVIYVPFMQGVFKTVALGFTDWLIIFACASSAFMIPKIHGWFGGSK